MKSALTLAIAALVLAACGSHDAADPADDTTPFAAATSTVPDGWTKVRCSDLRPDGSGLAVEFVIPPVFGESSRNETSCSFGNGETRSVGVSWDVGTSLKSWREKYVDPYEDIGGDEDVSDVTFDDDAPAFGGGTGDLLTYESFNDGSPHSTQVVQADGVRLTWLTPPGELDRFADQYDAVVASLAVVESDTSTCSFRGRTVVFRPPLPQTTSIQNYGTCLMVFDDRAMAPSHQAEVVPAPQVPLARLAAKLRKQRDVSDVVLEPGAAELAGVTADRLTYLITENAEPAYGIEGGAWRVVVLATPDVQVSWSAPPVQWTDEEDDATAFFSSIEVP